jgi:hypothetical protein
MLRHPPPKEARVKAARGVRSLSVLLLAVLAGCSKSSPGSSGARDGGTAGAGGTAGSGGGGGATGGTGGGGTGGGAGGAAGASDGGVGMNEPAPGHYTVGTAPPAGTWSGTPVTSGAVPVIVYPSNGTRFPRNIYRTLFQWRAPGATQFRLTFTGPRTTVEAFTDGKHPQCATVAGAGCWEADENAWFLIASGNAGSMVTVTIDALDASTSPATVRRSATLTIGFSKQNVEGAIFYWSTTAAGIRRASVAAATPENYMAGKPPTTYTSPADQIKCVACHVVSRDGKYLVAPVQAASGAGLWITEVTRAAPPTPLIKNVPDTKGHGFATISPDDSRVVAAWGGKMWMLDRASGAKVGDIALGGVQATHPDWSPDNAQLVFATGSGDAPSGASIATLSWDGSKWGAPAVLVAGAANKLGPPGLGSNLFPMHSPDGKWIAFSRGKGGHDDLTALLHVVGAKTGTPVELTAANRVVSNQMTDGLFQNSQPTWAPAGDYHWIAFNSQREYGLILPKGTQQIWVAAVDPAKLGGSEDPSFPAFRLQFQGLQEDNHRAYWTLDVRDAPTAPPPPPPPDGGMCIPTGMKCDPVTDTCCNTTDRCDSQDDGMTYNCRPPVIQ